MIKVSYQVSKDMITYLEIKGHAESGEYGKDLICAACSAITFGLLNGLDMLDLGIEIKDSGNNITIINNTDDITVQNYLQLTLIQLETVQTSYPQFINIKRKELS